LAKFWGGVEDFGDTLTGNPLAYCGPGSSEEAGLANFLDFDSGLAGGDPELDAEGEEDAAPTVNGETAATAYGRAAHAAYDYGPGFVKEFTLENGKRADAVNFATREVIELKPNNPRAIGEGLRQAQGYAQQLTQEFPGSAFTYRVVTYDRP
jgi:Restriction endonuclease fold toxin 9